MVALLNSFDEVGVDVGFDGNGLPTKETADDRGGAFAGNVGERAADRVEERVLFGTESAEHLWIGVLSRVEGALDLCICKCDEAAHENVEGVFDRSLRVRGADTGGELAEAFGSQADG